MNQLKQMYRTIAAKIQAQKWAWRNSDKSLPIYAESAVPGLKIHLGSGPINIQGWVNVDARPYSHVHVVSAGFELREFADGTVSEIYLCHVLEHFSFEESKQLLRGLRKKLVVGGVVRISVPSFDKLIDIYEKSNQDLEKIKYAVMGGQDYQYNFHKSLYNASVLRNIFTEGEYSDVVEWDTLADFGIDLGDWSTGAILVNGRSMPISLNMKAVKRGA